MKNITKEEKSKKKIYKEENWLTDLKEIEDLANNDDSFISQDLFRISEKKVKEI